MNDRPEKISPSLRTVALGSVAAATALLYWLLLAISLNPELSIVHDVKGARYAGPLVWPARWFHLASLEQGRREWLFTLLLVALVALWLGAVWLVRRDRRKATTAIIAGAFGLFGLMFVFGPSFQSQDVFSYAFAGRALSVYHRNPFILVPAARPHDVFYPLIGWKDNASVYGPVFSYFSYVITRIAGNSVASTVLGFKLLAAAAYAACLPMVYTLARRLSPGRENMALLISAWCPVLVLHFLGAGHNDILAVAFVLGGYLLYRKGYLLTGIAVVTFAVAVKLTAALALAPLVVLYIRDRNGAPLKRLLASGAACVGVLAATYLPLWGGTAMFDSTVQISKLYSGSAVPRLVSSWYARVLAHGGVTLARATTIAEGRVRLVFLAVLFAGTIVFLWSARDFRSMAVATASILLLWVLCATYILPWYLAIGLMVAAVTGWTRITGLTIAAASILVLYRLPMPAGPAGAPTFYTAYPLLILLAGWGAIAAVSRMKSRSAAGAVQRVSGEVLMVRDNSDTGAL
jgi:alpha-1,6-mannosyltransferase